MELKAVSDINGGLKTTLKMFRDDCGRFPTAEEGLKVLISAPPDGSLTNWRGPYLDPADSILEDPWGHKYVYDFPAVHNTNSYDIYSLGSDGVSKTGGNDPDDINNWGKSLAPSRMTLARLIDDNEDWLLFIPFLFLAGMINQLAFPEARKAAMENRCVDWLWFATALIALMVLVTPKISG